MYKRLGGEYGFRVCKNRVKRSGSLIIHGELKEDGVNCIALELVNDEFDLGMSIKDSELVQWSISIWNETWFGGIKPYTRSLWDS